MTYVPRFNRYEHQKPKTKKYSDTLDGIQLDEQSMKMPNDELELEDINRRYSNMWRDQKAFDE